jgi:hypothetical protein
VGHRRNQMKAINLKQDMKEAQLRKILAWHTGDRVAALVKTSKLQTTWQCNIYCFVIVDDISNWWSMSGENVAACKRWNTK